MRFDPDLADFWESSMTLFASFTASEVDIPRIDLHLGAMFCTPRSKALRHAVEIFRKLALAVPLLGVLAGCSAGVPFGPEAEARRAAQERYAKAKALFEERCKTAGVVIRRTVTDVEGIELTKIRQPIPWGGREYFDPMYPEAALAVEYRGNDYINQFLMTESIDWRDPQERGTLNTPDFDAGSKYPLKRGYRFIEYLDPGKGSRFRAQLDSYPPGTNLWGKSPKLIAIASSATQYALDYEDIVNPEDRQLWVAGTVLKVVDKQTGEVIAQLTRYIWDSGFGATSTSRRPWEHAGSRRSQICPSIPGAAQDTSRKFVDAVLIPKQGD
ncbi:hypothetical protein ACG04Q_04040 [Roseateles sp. DXS20W]|uniref:Uncharacterized protein n=1 Tax=Pelomonas lactea TaxID=3299030 RepID=A0ABW7GFK4_9BURK